MIGVIANSSDADVVQEFFELFKTPWEFFRAGVQYDVVLCASTGECNANAKLILYYAGTRTSFDKQLNIPTSQQRSTASAFSFGGRQIPIYGASVSVTDDSSRLMTDRDSSGSVASVRQSCHGKIIRIGYDLFSEVRSLLTAGQPEANAAIPTLDLHIQFLRDCIAGSGISFVEIPPAPEGYRFIACLTHDVDHPLIRNHRWDHTMFGFLSRALWISARDLLRGRISGHALLQNWWAAIKLPFVYIGLAKDFWSNFDVRYAAIEQDLPSTYFVIPYKGYPGKKREGKAPIFRASGYAAKELAAQIKRLQDAGKEVGLHGIDAWFDSAETQKELNEIRQLTAQSEIGVRMHWLYGDAKSPSALDAGGAAYDSTVGYNGAVGYRAGTTQAFKPFDAGRLLELPLHVMDTALFYPAHLGYSSEQAKIVLTQMVANAVVFGGALTVNWHDRSLAPERLWVDCYRELIQNMKRQGAWFATAGQTTRWFRKRRSARFVKDDSQPGGVRVNPADDTTELPALTIQVHDEAAHQTVSGEAPLSASSRAGDAIGMSSVRK